jgi:hypothetical protein
MATRKKGSRAFPWFYWSHRAKRGVFLIGLTLAFVVAALFAMTG